MKGGISRVLSSGNTEKIGLSKMADSHFWLQWDLPVVKERLCTRQVQGAGRRTISRVNGAERWWQQTWWRRISGDGNRYLFSRTAVWHPHHPLLCHFWGTAIAYSITLPGEEQGVYISCINYLLMNIFRACCFKFPVWMSLHSQRLFALVLLHNVCLENEDIVPLSLWPLQTAFWWCNFGHKSISGQCMPEQPCGKGSKTSRKIWEKGTMIL